MWFGLAVGDAIFLMKNIKIINSFPLLLFPVFFIYYSLHYIHVENKPQFFSSRILFKKYLQRWFTIENINRVGDIQLSFAALIQFHFS